MISLPEDVVAELPIDELGLLLLRDLIDTQQWNEHNYLLAATRQYSGPALEAVAEAYAWLKARAFVARDPTTQSDNAIFVTKTGRRVSEGGDHAFHVHERLQVGLHPQIDRQVRRQFMLGEHALGIFSAMKAVEVRVRNLAGLPDELVGVDLMTQAFKPAGGRLTDAGVPRGEREGMMSLFRGAYAVLRNPAGHRDINYEDVIEAAEAVATASMLMRILDRIDQRLNGPSSG
jgi:uncharacterized protein (TIGR02391 family)